MSGVRGVDVDAGGAVLVRLRILLVGGAVAGLTVLAAVPASAAPAHHAAVTHPAKAAKPAYEVCGGSDEFQLDSDYGYAYNGSANEEPVTWYGGGPYVTNWCLVNVIGGWGQYMQYGTDDSCLAYEASQNVLVDYSCEEQTWEYWSVNKINGLWMLQSDFNNQCATFFAADPTDGPIETSLAQCGGGGDVPSDTNIWLANIGS